MQNYRFFKTIYTFLCATCIKKISSLTKIEKRYEGLLEKLLEKQKRLEKVYKRIDEHEIIERINIKEETN